MFAQTDTDFSHIIPGLSLTTGYRYTWDSRSITQQRLQSGSVLLGVPTCGLAGFPGLDVATCTEHLKTQFSNYNYDVSLNYQVTPRTLVYLATRRGYKAGGFNFAATQSAYIEYAPETVTDWEAGLKTEWQVLGVPVRTNVAIYRGDYDDIQYQDIITPPPGKLAIPAALVLNDDPFNGVPDKAILQGGEVEVTFAPLRDLTVNGYYGYASGRYTQFDYSPDNGVTTKSLSGPGAEGRPQTTPSAWLLRLRPATCRGRRAAGLLRQLLRPLQDLRNDLNASSRHYTNLDLRLGFARRAWADPSTWRSTGPIHNDRHVTTDDDLLTAVGVEATTHADPTMYGIEFRYHFGR